MGLESGDKIGDLNASWPLGSDPKSQGDDHLRLLKTVLKNDVYSKGADDAPFLKTDGSNTCSSLNISSTNPVIQALDTNQDPSANLREISFNSGGFYFRTRDSAGTAVSTDYTIRGTGTGADLHSFAIHNSASLTVGETGTTIVQGEFYVAGGVDSGSETNAGFRVSSSGFMDFQRAGSSSDGSRAMQLYRGSQIVYKIISNGDVANANNSYGALSDARRKQNIEDSGSQWSDVKAMRFRKYQLNGSSLVQLGVVAQELSAAGMGGLVAKDEETGDLSVKYSVLLLKCAKALQEAMSRIEALEAAAGSELV